MTLSQFSFKTLPFEIKCCYCSLAEDTLIISVFFLPSASAAYTLFIGSLFTLWIAFYVDAIWWLKNNNYFVSLRKYSSYENVPADKCMVQVFKCDVHHSKPFCFAATTTIISCDLSSPIKHVIFKLKH